jgi:hypothetical protein
MASDTASSGPDEAMSRLPGPFRFSKAATPWNAGDPVATAKGFRPMKEK